MKEKISKFYKKFKIFLKTYPKTNVLFISFVLLSLINSTIARCFTVNNLFNLKPMLADISVLVLIGAIGYFIKPKKQFIYYLSISIIFTLICLINSVYYTNYTSFASISLLATAKQGAEVAGALTEIVQFRDFIYLIPLGLFVLINKKLKGRGYFEYVEKIEVGKVRAVNTLVAGLVILGIFISTLTGTDLSRLNKQWNREFIVMQFGVYVYQINDVIASLKPQISPLFGIDDAYKKVTDFYEERNNEKPKNKYTNIYEGKNIITIHAESIQNFLLNKEINGQVITPNLNKLSSEGMYFSNFYAQESVGTSSDTEFTLNTSLMPANSGTVFVNYFDREYNTIPKLLKEKDYYSFSMHANKCSMWNRDTMHEKLGYDHFYCYTDAYKMNDKIGLGLSDIEFFTQSVPIISEINKEHKNFYGTMIMLSNHTPWADVDKLVDLDLTMKYTDDFGVEQTAPYLEGTTLGRYIKAVHYADKAIGVFIDELDKAGILDNTVIVVYGDHDAKIKKSEYNRYYNYNPKTKSIKDKTEEDFVKVDFYNYELNREVPFIIWNKNDKQRKEITEVTGMYNVMPTLGNMFNFYNEYALGKDMFSIKENLVVFPDGNWMTNKMYYNSQSEEGLPLTLDEPVSAEYIKECTNKTQEMIDISDKIIVYDLLKKQNDLKQLEID